MLCLPVAGRLACPYHHQRCAGNYKLSLMTVWSKMNRSWGDKTVNKGANPALRVLTHQCNPGWAGAIKVLNRAILETLRITKQILQCNPQGRRTLEKDQEGQGEELSKMRWKQHAVTGLSKKTELDVGALLMAYALRRAYDLGRRRNWNDIWIAWKLKFTLW